VAKTFGVRIVLGLVLLLAFEASTASAQTTARSRAHEGELGAGIGLVALGVVGGAFTALSFLESEIRHQPMGCPGMAGCPNDPPIVAYDPNLLVLGAVLGAASIASIVIGAVVFLVPALEAPEPPPLAVSITPYGVSATWTLRL
jgi:hypothetical protein